MTVRVVIVAAILVGLVVLAAFSWLLRGTIGALVLDNLHWSLAYAIAAGFAGWGWHHSTRRSPERVNRFWLTLGLGLYWMGQMVWNVQVPLGWLPFPEQGLALGLHMLHGIRHGKWCA